MFFYLFSCLGVIRATGAKLAAVDSGTGELTQPGAWGRVRRRLGVSFDGALMDTSLLSTDHGTPAACAYPFSLAASQSPGSRSLGTQHGSVEKGIWLSRTWTFSESEVVGACCTLHSEALPLVVGSKPPSSSVIDFRPGAVHEFTGTKAARRKSGPGHEKAVDAGLRLFLGIEQMFVIRTPGVALSVVSSVDPTSSTVKQTVLMETQEKMEAATTSLEALGDLWTLVVSMPWSPPRKHFFVRGKGKNKKHVCA